MAQETRKDPRAKVLTMTVRYKSATLDEFIEHHSHDVSRGGMFIKTPSPFPPGTLLKFEVRISGDQRVMQGVGRVVWKREAGEVHDGAPAGMGVKFIKIDDASRGVIDQLVTRSGGALSAFERGGGGNDAAVATPIAAPVAAKPAAAATPAPAVRKATMIGLGAMGAEAADVAKVLSEPPQGFFPSGKDGVEEPAPEDRTVMKQAAELLQDALREAGGSMEDVGTPVTSGAKGVSTTPPPQPVSAPPRPGPTSDEPAAYKEKPKDTSASDAEETPIPEPTPVKAPAEKPRAAPIVASARPAPSSARPAPTSARRVSIPAEDGSEGASEASGAGRIAVLVIAVAAIGGAIFVLTRPPAEEPVPPPAIPAEVKPEPQPEPPPAQTAEPVPSAEAPPASAAPSVEPTPPPAAAIPEPAPAVEPKPTVKRPKAVVEPKPVTEPKPVVEPVPAPAPKPVAEPKPPAAEVKPPAPTPTVPAPAPAQPKPKPAPKAPEGDNPY